MIRIRMYAPPLFFPTLFGYHFGKGAPPPTSGNYCAMKIFLRSRSFLGSAPPRPPPAANLLAGFASPRGSRGRTSFL